MNAKRLKQMIEMWHRVAVKNNNWWWKVFMHINWNWSFEWTAQEVSIEECLETWLTSYTNSVKKIEDDFTDEYKIVTPAPTLLKKWDQCEILENVREYGEEKERAKNCIDMIWKWWLILDETTNLGYGIWDYYFPHRAVAPVYPTKYIGEEATAYLHWKKYRVIIEELIEE